MDRSMSPLDFRSIRLGRTLRRTAVLAGMLPFENRRFRFGSGLCCHIEVQAGRRRD